MGMQWAPLTVLAALATGGCGPPAERPAEYQAAIVSGEPAPGDLAVVALARPGGDILCTGTLVSRRLVATAAHCADGPLVAWFRAPPGADRMLAVAATELAPGFSRATLANDLALVVLAAPAPAEVAPVPPAWRAPAPGEVVRFVGFGYTAIGAAGDYGQRRQIRAAVTEVGATTFRYGVATCEGDSGGPALIRNGGRDQLVGVNSTGDAVCGLYGVDTRVDTYADWIASQAARLDPASCGTDAEVAADCPVHARTEASVTPGCAMAGGARCPRWLALASLLAASSVRRAIRARKGGSYV